MVNRRAHTLYELFVAYALFGGLVVAVAPDPRPAAAELREGLEAEVSRGILAGELCFAEAALRRGESLRTGELVLGAWPSASQLTGLRVVRTVEPERGGYAVELVARWTLRGEDREQRLVGWVREVAR